MLKLTTSKTNYVGRVYAAEVIIALLSPGRTNHSLRIVSYVTAITVEL
jgi:hypothetical protein